VASSGELFTGFGDTGLDGGDELEGIMFVPPIDTVRSALNMGEFGPEDATIPRMWVHLLELDLM
jgi:hypothetical protein